MFAISLLVMAKVDFVVVILHGIAVLVVGRMVVLVVVIVVMMVLFVVISKCQGNLDTNQDKQDFGDRLERKEKQN